jgi:hypothetical protein
LALAEARTLFSDENDFLLVSLGCGGAARAGFPADLQQKRRHIFEWSLTAQSACADYQMGAFLPAQRYIRIQAIRTGLFFVHHGVGSERWSADGFTRLTQRLRV